MESLLRFIFQNNVLLIELFVFLILLTVAYLAFRNYVIQSGSEAPNAGPEFNQDKLEKMLQQILAQAQAVPQPQGGGASAVAGDSTGAAAVPTGSEDAQKLLSEINNLKKDLQEKQSYIENQKNQPGGSAAAGESAGSVGLSNDEKEKLNQQIRELQGKLSEYEIISEDIADLSFFKEENSKLQKELEALKAAPATAAPPVAAETPAPAAAVVVPKPTPAIKPAAPTPAAASSPKAEPVVAAVNPAPIASAATIAEPAAQAEMPKAEPVVAAVNPAPVEVPPSAEPVAAAAPEIVLDESLGIDEELMREFEKAAESLEPPGVENGQTVAEIDISEVDIDQVMKEATPSMVIPLKPDEKEVMDQFQKFVKKG